ncbi:MAG: ACT domain-containing protein, partial [Gammaproteobacteria bacterium]|nr:ACT domain-containing protein [Gammaproteobacteria bacterium]
KPGVLADITRILGDAQISIEAFIQKESPVDVPDVPLVILTHKVREAQMNEAIAKIEALSTINGAITRLRVEHLDA